MTFAKPDLSLVKVRREHGYSTMLNHDKDKSAKSFEVFWEGTSIGFGDDCFECTAVMAKHHEQMTDGDQRY